MTDLHVAPVDDYYDHDLTPDCLCGPSIEVGPRGTLTVHHALDGREMAEGTVTPCECGCTEDEVNEDG